MYKKIKLKNGKTIDEHRLIWIKVHGKIPKGFVVHHINENKLDNRIENLEIIELSVHSRMHMVGKPSAKRKEFTEEKAWCSTCEKYLSPNQFHKDSSSWNGLRCQCKNCRSKTRSS